LPSPPTLSPYTTLFRSRSRSPFAFISSSTETPNSSANLGSKLISGHDKSRSHFDTALSVTPIFTAKSSWVIPLCLRSEAIILPRDCFSMFALLFFYGHILAYSFFSLNRPSVYFSLPAVYPFKNPFSTWKPCGSIKKERFYRSFFSTFNFNTALLRREYGDRPSANGVFLL